MTDTQLGLEDLDFGTSDATIRAALVRDAGIVARGWWFDARYDEPSPAIPADAAVRFYRDALGEQPDYTHVFELLDAAEIQRVWIGAFLATTASLMGAN